MKKGRLEAITGCMYSGKSLEILIRIERAMIAKQTAVVFKPAIDDRHSVDMVSSRSGIDIEAVCVNQENPREILNHVDSSTDVVAIDEIQFFAGELEEVVEELIDKGIRVIVSGLDTDFRGAPFGPVPNIMARADSLTKLTAICVKCGKDATRTQRLIAGEPAPRDGDQVLVGDSDFYEARCRDCYQLGN